MAVPICGAALSCTAVHHGLLREQDIYTDFASGTARWKLMLPILLWQIIMFSDLECDYINPIDLCNKLNQVGALHDDELGHAADTRSHLKSASSRSQRWQHTQHSLSSSC